MTKLNFVYIGYDWDGIPKTNLPKGEITAIRVKYDDGEFHYVPIIPSSWQTVDQVKEVWVCHQGWIKVGSRKKYIIPVFDGYVEHYQEYVDKWGLDVMSYCLNGDLFYREWDCANQEYRNEFNALRYYGPEIFNKYSTIYKQLRDLQREVFNEKFQPMFTEHGYGNNMVKNYIFKPEYNLGYSFLPVPCLTVDILHDEKLMDELYKKVRYWELYRKHEQYPEFAKRKKEADDYRNGRTRSEMCWDSKYDDLCDHYLDIDHIIDTDIYKQIKDEVENGCENYPIQVKAKMIKMYGEKFERLYQAVLEFDDEKVAA